MTAPHRVYSSASPCPSSLDSELPPSGERAYIQDETSPLLPTKYTPRRSIFVWWNLFFNDNLGLLLVAASQFFFSAMNMSVKWLNSSDEPVPTLEVCESSSTDNPMQGWLFFFAICSWSKSEWYAFQRNVWEYLKSCRVRPSHTFAQSHICPAFFLSLPRRPLTIFRCWMRIPDPVLGPKGVRALLVLRGFAGCVPC